MSALPKVTALVPSYNHGRFIKQRIESILQQTYQNVELIVIDDCSKDESDAVITSLQAQHGFNYIRNEQNSGTPFAAWESVLALATGDYIWVCESDDFAEPEFLQTAVSALENDRSTVLFYCHSWVVDMAGQRIDHTQSYFHQYWKNARWDSEFVADGHEELVNFQLRGQTVPNMSSALISTKAFRGAYTPYLKNFKLTGDWIFIGDVLRYGNVLFSNLALNNFRRHEETARVRVNGAAEKAEFILTIYYLFRKANRPVGEFVRVIAPTLVGVMLGPEKKGNVLKRLFEISWRDTVCCVLLLAASMPLNLEYFGKTLARKANVKKKF